MEEQLKYQLGGTSYDPTQKSNAAIPGIPTDKETITSRLDRMEKENEAFRQHVIQKIEKLEHYYQMLASYIGR